MAFLNFDFGSYIVHRITDFAADIYVAPTDKEETDEDKTEYVTTVIDDGPFRRYKFIKIEDVADYYGNDPAVLNTAYHSIQDYVEATTKYGYISKHVKFDNADTLEKLEEYAYDWAKNNYYGGITSFEITAMDLHLLGYDVDPYMVGDRIDVGYPDPDSQQVNMKTYTCISAEYDLYNPEKDKYKIGVPDVTLNKTYGESSTSGGGGGGTNKDEDEENDDLSTVVEGAEDKLQAIKDWILETGFNLTNKDLKGVIDNWYEDLQTPSEKNETGNFWRSLTPDALKSAYIESTTAKIKTSLEAAYGKFSNIVTVDGNIVGKSDLTVSKTTKSKDVEVTNNVDVAKTTTSKDLTVTDTANIKNLKINNQNIRFAIVGGKPQITIGNSVFKLATVE